jgi:uncharacterized protein
MKSVLIIFYRNPILGKVKTRLAYTIGDGNALAVYLKLVEHTRSITTSLAVDVALYYSEYIDTEDNWSQQFYRKERQIEGNLGQRMQHAFESEFSNGYDNVCIIGTDCLELSRREIDDAFGKLSSHDVVIGPAKDGGYYLLGMKNMNTAFFTEKKWGSDSVLIDTVEDCKTSGLTCGLLPTLSDIDTIDDLPSIIRNRLMI